MHEGVHQENEKTTHGLGENIFDKVFVFRVYKEFLQLNKKKTNNPLKNGQGFE